MSIFSVICPTTISRGRCRLCTLNLSNLCMFLFVESDYEEWAMRKCLLRFARRKVIGRGVNEIFFLLRFSENAFAHFLFVFVIAEFFPITIWEGPFHHIWGLFRHWKHCLTKFSNLPILLFSHLCFLCLFLIGMCRSIISSGKFPLR